MIRSSKITNKYANINKNNSLNYFIDEYKKVVIFLIDELWKEDKIPNLLPKQLTDKVNSWLSKRAIQCAGKQASAIVRGTKKKQEQRLFVIHKLTKEGCFKKARKLQKIYDSKKVSKPNVNNICPELDSRFVKIDLDNQTSFDGWLTLTSLGNKLKIIIPFKRHKHLNKLFSKGTLKTGVRLSKDKITLMFDIEEVKKKTNGTTLGIDIGIKDLLSCSNEYQSKTDIHGHDLESIQLELRRKKKGSKSFKKAQEHRKNYINWSINKLNIDNIKQVNFENIKYLRYKKRNNRYLSHFIYSEIFDKLDSLCEEHGVHVLRVNPTYTSQRCSECGWVRKRNRKGKQFICDKCGYSHDSDINAARNISFNLSPIRRKKRLLNLNRSGFYWDSIVQEPIVSEARKI